MADASMSRRRFLIVAGAGIGGALAAGAGWLLRTDPTNATAPLPSSTGVSTVPPTTAAARTVPPAETTAPIATTAAPEPTTTIAVPASVPVICKEAWGASGVSGEFTLHTIEHITVHHTAVTLSSNTEAPDRARQHQGYHQSLGWPDLAYHYLIDANGHVYEGRPVDAVGDTATDYDPTGHFFVCCEGYFTSQEITPAQYESMIKMLAWGAAEFGIEPASIRGHRDVASTTCPGDNLYPQLADGSIAADVAAVVADGAPQLEVVCGTEGVDLIAEIEAGDA